MREAPLRAVARIAAASGAKVYAEVFPARLQRGAGLPSVERLAYFAEQATVQLGRIKHLILIDAKAPASFFAYPGKQSYLVPDGCQVHQLVGDSGDVASSLDALVDRLGAAGVRPPLQRALPAEATDWKAHRGEGVPGDRGRAARGGHHF